MSVSPTEYPADSIRRRIKAEVAFAIIQHIGENNLTQAAAAKIMLVQRTHVNDLFAGRIEPMTINALVAMAARLGLDPFKTKSDASSAD